MGHKAAETTQIKNSFGPETANGCASKLILFQLCETLPKNSVLTVLWSFGV